MYVCMYRYTHTYLSLYVYGLKVDQEAGDGGRTSDDHALDLEFENQGLDYERWGLKFGVRGLGGWWF